MRLNNVLYRQHIDRMFKKHWVEQSKRNPIKTNAEKILNEKCVPVVDAVEFVQEKYERFNLDIIGEKPKPIQFDNTHPNWHDRVCYFYRDNNALLEGLNQAKIITKTVELTNGLPEVILQNVSTPSKDVHKRVQNLIMASHLFDTEQEKLPKIKDPLRPAYNFPRIFGITNERTNILLTSKLIQMCESLADKSLTNQRTIINNANFFVPLNKSNDLLQLELSADQMLLSTKPLDVLTTQPTENIDLPNLFPIKHTITLVPENIYETNNIYPVNKNALKSHPHTIFVHYDHTNVKNLYEESVEESQILGRSLMKTFAAAAAYARFKYGNDVELLPQPITLQCVQTDGIQFHFAVLQLNTLNLEGDGGVKNVWYSIPRIPLFNLCEYRLGKPLIEGYNPEVIKYMIAFYNHV